VLFPVAPALADSADSRCTKAAGVIDSAQQRPLTGELEAARRAVALCDAFETELFLARVQAARQEWPEAHGAYLHARALAGGDPKMLSQVDLELALLAADKGPRCEAVAAFDAAAQALAERQQAVPDWFTNRRLAVEAQWTAAGLPAREIACALDARREQSKVMQTPHSSTRLFCSEVALDIPVNFATDSSALDASASHQVDELAQALAHEAKEQDQIRVDGHADERGSEQLNQPLSEQRAAHVAAALANRLHLPDQRFQAKGHGSKEPKYTEHTEEAYRLNRRVEITLIPPECRSS